jgi:hypothetical protein
MADSLLFVRGFLGVLCISFAHFLGRSLARKPEPKGPKPQAFRWSLRTLIAAVGVMWGAGFDRLTLAFFALAIVSAAIGFYKERHLTKKEPEEDLSQVIFPKE